MASLTRDLTAAAGAAFSAMGLEERWGAVRRSDKPELADFQCNGAMGAAKGSAGGRTVGTSVLDGFAMLQAMGLPVDASHPAAVAAATPPVGTGKARARRHAGSLPLKVQLQLLHLLIFAQ